MTTLELAVFHPASPAIAQKAGIPRIELCEDYASGGITPSIGFLRGTRSVYKGHVFVMIRPRPGDFVYTDREFDTMLQQVEQFRSDGVDGFVAGMLDDHRAIDRRRLAEFMKACGPAPVTFHKAFDKIQDWRNGLDILIDNGCSRVLTSGGAPSAMEGLERLSEMIEYASGRIIVLPGGGIRSNNVTTTLTGCIGISEIHTAAIVNKSGSGFQPIADADEVQAMISVCKRG